MLILPFIIVTAVVLSYIIFIDVDSTVRWWEKYLWIAYALTGILAMWEVFK